MAFTDHSIVEEIQDLSFNRYTDNNKEVIVTTVSPTRIELVTFAEEQSPVITEEDDVVEL